MNELISLKCPDCKNNLTGENNSQVFFCLKCNSCFDIEGKIDKKKSNKYSVGYIKPKIKKNLPLIYFPFWKISSEYKISNTVLDSETSGSENFYIPAFFIKNISYFGDIGFYYLKKKINLISDEPKNFPVFPADRSLKYAIKYPLIYLTKIESEKKSGNYSEININNKDFFMELVPFYWTDRKYCDSILLWKYPTGALI